MSPMPLTMDDFQKIARGHRAEEIQIALKNLQQSYTERDTALKIMETMNGWQMTVKEEIEDKVTHLALATTELNKSILRTLAFIAYKEPVKQSAIVKLRNNKAYDHLKMLESKGFIERSPIGQTFEISTTDKFKKYFGEKAIELKKIPKPREKTVTLSSVLEEKEP